MTVKEVAEYLKTHPQSIYALIRDKKIRHYPLEGIGIRFRRDEVDEWAKQQACPCIPKEYLISFEKENKIKLEDEEEKIKNPEMEMAKRYKCAYGSISVRKTKKGFPRFYSFFQLDGKRYEQVLKGATTLRQALQAHYALVEKVFREKYGLANEPAMLKKEEEGKENCITFEKFADLFLEKYCKVNNKAWRNAIAYTRLLKEFFKGKRLNEITSLDVENLKKWFMKRKMTKPTANNYLTCLGRMFTIAIEWGYIEEREKPKIRKFKVGSLEKARILTEEEELRLYNACTDDLKPIILTALYTGLRREEILNLKWKDIDFESRQIRARATKTGQVYFAEMNDLLFILFQKLKERNGFSEYVFVNPRTGKRYKTIQYAFEKARKLAGLEDLRFHDLRHTFATRVSMKGGAGDRITQELLGHRSIKTTERYIHPLKQQKLEVVNRIINEKLEKNLIEKFGGGE